jgi:hypothetical protein
MTFIFSIFFIKIDQNMLFLHEKRTFLSLSPIISCSLNLFLQERVSRAARGMDIPYPAVSYPASIIQGAGMPELWRFAPATTAILDHTL